MAETISQERRKEMLDDEEMETPDFHSVAMKIQRAREVYKAYGGDEEKPTKLEVVLWYLYELCSYFVHTVLIPIVLPLMISQTVSDLPAPPLGWLRSIKNLKCNMNQMQLYEALVHKGIKLGDFSFSPLEWASISWTAGLILSTPILGLISAHLDHGHNQTLIAAAATAVGAIFCLPAGFFRTPWIFPPYITAVVLASTTVGATHARSLGLMIRGFTGSTIRRAHFPDRRSFGSWLSLCSTSSGCLGSTAIASFTYFMLKRSAHFDALWVVSIFSGLKWALGLAHTFGPSRFTAGLNHSHTVSISHNIFAIFTYHHAAWSLAGVLLSSFVCMCVFGEGLLHAIGYICVERENLLYLLLVYFLFPMVSLPMLAHPLQQTMKLDAEKMQILGFALATICSGFGFYFRGSIWSRSHLLVFAAIQGTATGLLHAFGRVLWLDCSPAGKEGAFSVWFSWARAVGACAGFALATAMPGNIGKAFGISFWAGILGMIIVIFGNISSLRGAEEAGHVITTEKTSPAHGLESSF